MEGNSDFDVVQFGADWSVDALLLLDDCRCNRKSYSWCNYPDLQLHLYV